MEFELPGCEERLNKLIATWTEPEKKAFVLMQLKFDYIFMSTLFPTIFILCLWASKKFQTLALKNQSPAKYQFPRNLLLVLAILQAFALGFDISENVRLTKWIQQGYAGNMLLFETLVKLKFLFAIAGFFGGLVLIIYAQSKAKKV
jgi:hypothetical protein